MSNGSRPAAGPAALLPDLVATAVGLAVAAAVVAGFDLGGPPANGCAAVLGAAALLVAVHAAGGALVRRLPPDRSCASCLGALLLVPALLAAEPVALWLAVRLADGLGLSARLSGPGATVVAAVVVMLVGVTVRHLWSVLADRDGDGSALRDVARHLLAVAGLTLVVAVLDGTALAHGPGWRQLLTLVALGAVLGPKFSRLSLPGRGVRLRSAAGLAVATAGNLLKLWLVTWLSTWMALPLSIAGFAAFAVAALLVAVVMLPTSVAARRAADPGGPPLPGAMAELYGRPPPAP
ncbi:hypothetical protein GCM10009639_36920 [Kitasatospora putterlickiae]|uniref:Integral membrane protein n=1 Tax=Kitasatospora putterlickiae TaxID=221725 RepID=A0ABN1Y5I6_9ACTN